VKKLVIGLLLVALMPLALLAGCAGSTASQDNAARVISRLKRPSTAWGREKRPCSAWRGTQSTRTKSCLRRT